MEPHEAEQRPLDRVLPLRPGQGGKLGFKGIPGPIPFAVGLILENQKHFLEPVEHGGDGLGGQTGELPQGGDGHGPLPPQQVEKPGVVGPQGGVLAVYRAVQG